MEIGPFHTPTMRRPFDSFNSKLELFCSFTDDRLFWRFVKATVAACQAAIERVEGGCTVALGTVEGDNSFMLTVIIRGGLVNVDSGNGRGGWDVIMGWEGGGHK
jgi:hypothetical protein